MFESRPSHYAMLVDLDDPECPKSGPLGDPVEARKKLIPYDLDIAWNKALNCFSFVRWIRIRDWGCKVPSLIWNAIDQTNMKPHPVDDGMIGFVLRMDRSNRTVEQTAKLKQEAEKDSLRELRDDIGEMAEDEYKRIIDTERVRVDRVSVPEIPK